MDQSDDNFEFDDEFWAEMERREQEMNEHPECALTHDEVMASLREATREVRELDGSMTKTAQSPLSNFIFDFLKE